MAPQPPAPERASRRKRVIWEAFPGSPMAISEYRPGGVLTGYGAQCCRHNDVGDVAGSICKKVLTFGQQGLTPEQCVLYLKRWLLKGKDVSVDGESSRTNHIKGVTRPALAKPVPGEGQIDLLLAELARRDV